MPKIAPTPAARRLLEHANSFPPLKDGRIYIEYVNGKMLYEDKTTAAEYWAGLQFAIAQGWLEYHESGTYVKFTPVRICLPESIILGHAPISGAPAPPHRRGG
ncbi:hypothetical protein [Bradyrhizobium genosp. P]|uniref:hypothetical protein n=1 Tax=Bradyrhizobium genosp. P TaxID=83641 RepID=UPI003CED9AC2